jgi:hypothetical protein
MLPPKSRKWVNHKHVARLMRTIPEEEVRLHDDADLYAAYQLRGRFLDDVYPHQHLHSALGH